MVLIILACCLALLVLASGIALVFLLRGSTSGETTPPVTIEQPQSEPAGTGVDPDVATIDVATIATEFADAWAVGDWATVAELSNESVVDVAR